MATVHVYLYLGSTNITTNNTEILITDIGEGGILPNLTCHTDLIKCCRNKDTGGQGSLGAWYYPDGSMVQRRSQAEGEDFYIRRNASQLIGLNRRESTNSLSPTGSYCCVIPTLGGERTLCANIGEAITHHYKIHIGENDIFIVVVCLSLSPLTNGMISYSDLTLGVSGVATYSCGTGYALKGDITRTCQSNGTWSGSTPTCESESNMKIVIRIGRNFLYSTILQHGYCIV